MMDTMPAPPRPPDHHDGLLTVHEVADRLRVSKMTVYRLCHDGVLPSVRVGKQFRIRESALRVYLRGDR